MFKALPISFSNLSNLFQIYQLLHFLMHLRGEPIGLSVGGLVVIDKSLGLSVCYEDILVHYYLLNLPNDLNIIVIYIMDSDGSSVLGNVDVKELT